MIDTNLSYLADRARAEQLQAARATDPRVKGIHATLAQSYSLKAMQCVLNEVRAR